jgi:hypothetical protein
MVHDRITTDPEVMGGTPCIRGLRVPVATVVHMVADGMSTREILATPRTSRRRTPRQRSGTQRRPYVWASCRY